LHSYFFLPPPLEEDELVGFPDGFPEGLPDGFPEGFPVEVVEGKSQVSLY
jgi:hypothetical protein